VLSQALMEPEVEEYVGAGRHERSVGRTGHRDGYPERSRDTRAGSVELKVPRVRDSLEPLPFAFGAAQARREGAFGGGSGGGVRPRRRHAQGGRFGRDPRDDTGIGKSRVGRPCEELDEEVERLRERPRDGRYPYVWVDATYYVTRPARTDGWPRRRW
jgi:putative transposase